MGFPVPFGGWLRGRFAPVVEEFVLGARAAARGYFDPAALRQLVAEDASGRAPQPDALWLLINLEIWHRLFVDGDAPGDVMQGSCAFSG
jgi:asparagine synthase (glutamine-hydrolysing)